MSITQGYFLSMTLHKKKPSQL